MKITLPTTLVVAFLSITRAIDASPIIPADQIDSRWEIKQHSDKGPIGFVHYHLKEDWRYPLIEVQFREFQSENDAKTFMNQKFSGSPDYKKSDSIPDSFEYADIKKTEGRVDRFIFTVTQSGPLKFDDRLPFIKAYRKHLKMRTEQGAAANP